MKLFTSQAELDAQETLVADLKRERDEARSLLAKLRADLDAKLPDRDVALRDAAATVHALDVAYATLETDRDRWRDTAEKRDKLLTAAEKEIDTLKDEFLDGMKIVNEEKDALRATHATALAALEERLRTAQSLHDAEAARHAETRAARDEHAQDAVAVGKELDAAKLAIVELRARAERAEDGVRKSCAREDAVVAELRTVIAAQKGA